MRVFSLSFIFSLFPIISRADESVYTSDSAYDAADYGDFPIHTYMSTDLISPHINALTSSPECDSTLSTFITPRGYRTPVSLATILDQDGLLVWTFAGLGQIYNFMVQEYLGEQYLTFWAGNDAVGGHGAGFYYMVMIQKAIFNALF